MPALELQVKLCQQLITHLIQLRQPAQGLGILALTLQGHDFTAQRMRLFMQVQKGALGGLGTILVNITLQPLTKVAKLGVKRGV